MNTKKLQNDPQEDSWTRFPHWDNYYKNLDVKEEKEKVPLAIRHYSGPQILP
ncbi:hypothetical protein H4219_002536, partial [Mycoemilia scoparia]